MTGRSGADEIGGGLTARERKRAIIAATVGNGLEFYDFVTFSFFAIQIGQTFFPSDSKFISLMAALATFGVGFAGRPIGAWILGGYADRHGRKPAMLLSMMMMGVAILVLGLTPSYASIGIAAPIIVVIARLVQGLALGGEVGSATAYLMESASDERRAWTVSWQGASQAIAAVAGAGTGLILSLVMSEADLTSYGWRIALLLGAVIVPFALIIRRSLPETMHEPPPPATGAASVEERRVFRRTVAAGLMAIGAGTIGSYSFGYMATYGQNTLNLGPTISFAGVTANAVAGTIGLLMGGLLSDRFGRKPLLLVPWGLFTLSIMPAFIWLTRDPTLFSFMTLNIVLMLFATTGQGALYAAISEGLPTRLRARGFAMIYSLPVAILGGTTQVVVTWLLEVTGNPLAIAWYLVSAAVIGLVGMTLFVETAPAVLRRRLIASPIAAS